MQKPTYKKFFGYRPGVVIDDLIVGIENSDGNTNVRFFIVKDTLKRFFERFETERTYNQSFQK